MMPLAITKWFLCRLKIAKNLLKLTLLFKKRCVRCLSKGHLIVRQVELFHILKTTASDHLNNNTFLYAHVYFKLPFLQAEDSPSPYRLKQSKSDVEALGIPAPCNFKQVMLEDNVSLEPNSCFDMYKKPNICAIGQKALFRLSNRSSARCWWLLYGFPCFVWIVSFIFYLSHLLVVDIYANHNPISSCHLSVCWYSWRLHSQKHENNNPNKGEFIAQNPLNVFKALYRGSQDNSNTQHAGQDMQPVRR